MDRAELKKGLKSLGILLAVMALVGAGSYFIGLLKSILYEKAEADAYGVASRYENWNNPTLAVFLWQEKEDADPDTVKEGTTPTGDVHGNSTAYSLLQLTPEQSGNNTAWDGFSEAKARTGGSGAPVLTIRNKTGGKVRAVYEFSTYRDPTNGEVLRPSLVWSKDVTRVPMEYHRQTIRNEQAQPWMWEGRNDVHIDWSGTAEDTEYMVLHLMGAAMFPLAEEERYNDLYQGGSATERITRTAKTSTITLYAMDPEDEDKILAAAVLEVTAYTAWRDRNTWGTNISDEQTDIFRRDNAPYNAYCTVRMLEYEETIVLE